LYNSKQTLIFVTRFSKQLVDGQEEER